MDTTELTPGTVVLIVVILVVCLMIWKNIIKFWMNVNKKDDNNQQLDEEEQLEEIKKNNPNLIPLATLLSLSDVWKNQTDDKRDSIIGSLYEDVERTNRLLKDAKSGKSVIIDGTDYGKVV